MPFLKRPYQHWAWVLGIMIAGFLFSQPVAFAQSAQDWSSPRQEYASWISDRNDLIPWTVEQHLNRRINILKGRTSAELAIATLPHLNSAQSAHDFALDLFNTWGIGNRKTNNGVLLFVSQADRRIEIITGKGLGDILPNPEVNRLIQQEIVPAFQQQDYATGIEQGVDAIATRLESQLPSTILPHWIPAVSVWIPWIVVVAGLALATTGTVQALSFSFTRVQVPIPTQGMNTHTFGSSSDTLANYALPKLLAKLFTPNEREWEQEIPEKPLGSVWLGGWLAGVGLIQGFWLFVLMHPEAELWETDPAAWGVFALGSSGWLLWGAAVSHRFVQGGRLGQILGLELLVAALLALLGGYLWVYQLPNGWAVIILMMVFALGGWIGWRVIVGDDFKFKRPRDYCCDRTGHPVQELSPQELEQVLTPDEILAQSMGNLEFRGWRAAHQSSPLSRDSVYLVRRNSYYARRPCVQCKSFAIETSERTVERTIKTTKKINRKKKEKITQVVPVKQTVITCRSCGAVTAYDQPSPTSSSDRLSSLLNTANSSPTASSSSNADSSNYDYTTNLDYGNSSSDFGGGSSDGGGAGSDW